MSAQEPKIQEIDENTQVEEQIDDGSNVHVINRNEKKARKMIQKLGLKKVDNISRVFFRTSRGSMFTINEPTVYKNPGTNTYVIFGEAKVDNHQQNLSQLQQMLGQSGAAGQAQAPADDDEKAPKDQASIQADLEAAASNMSLNDSKAEDQDDGEELNPEDFGVDPGNVDLICEQVTGCSRNKAIRALKKANNDIVNAVMDLTS